MVSENSFELDERASVLKIGLGFFQNEPMNLSKFVKLDGFLAMQINIRLVNLSII